MPARPASDVTDLLIAWRKGDSQALDHLLPLVYAELHRLAHERMRGEWAGPHAADHRACQRGVPAAG